MPPSPSIDALTSRTLKHLREHWWDDTFTAFLVERLRPRPGNRILDVGCGEGLAEVSLGQMHISQVRMVGVDLAPAKVAEARRETAAHNLRVGFAAADAGRLPFAAGVFDAVYSVAVLQYARDLDAAVAELARVTAEGGRVLVVEPDNSARYRYSSVPAGQQAFEVADRFFAAVAPGERIEPAIGPRVPGLFARHRIEPLEVRLFPVSKATLGVPPEEVWQERRGAVARALGAAPGDAARTTGAELLAVLEQYRAQAHDAGSAFVEIQNTMLFSTLGQKTA